MPAGESPSIRPVRSSPAGRAPQVGHPLHFLLAACGVSGGVQGHLVSVPSFLSSATFPGTIFNSCSRSGSFVAGRRVGNHQVFPSVLPPFPFWRGARRPLLLSGQQRIENFGSISSSWFYRAVFGSTFMAAEGGRSSAPSMSGSSSSTRTSGSGGIDEGGGTGSTASLKVDSGSTTSSGGGEGEGGREDFPIVTMDPDAVQKFAEIEVRWGE